MVSVVIPNYNKGRYLRDCLRSVSCQTYRNIEIVVVDDCSTDDSMEVLEDVAKEESRLRIVALSVNAGVATARDRGIRSAKGYWCTTLDSDDVYVSSEKIEREVRVLETTPDPKSIAYSAAVILDKSGNYIRRRSRRQRLRSGDLFLPILARSIEIPLDFLLPRDLYFCVGGYDTTLCMYEDWDLKLRLAKTCNFIFTGGLGTGYRQTGAGLSSGSPERLRRSYFRVLCRYQSELSTAERVYVSLHHFSRRITSLVRRLVPNQMLDQISLMIRGY